MDQRAKGRFQQAIPADRTIASPLAAFVCWSILFCPTMLLAQNQPVSSSASAAQSHDHRVAFGQLGPAESTGIRSQPRFSFPENECSADFWDPYEAGDLAMAQSSARVQQDSLALMDPADAVQELPDEVVGAAEGVQPLNSLLLQPMPRVQQLDDEVIKSSESEQVHSPRPAIEAPFDPWFSEN